MPLTVRYLAALMRRKNEAELQKFDILDFHRIEPLALYRRDRRPMNLTLHQDMVVIRDPRSDILWRHAPWAYEALEKRLILCADRVFCVRRPAVDRYRQRFPAEAGRFHFTPTWFDSSRFSTGDPAQRIQARKELRVRNGWPEDSIVLIFVGRLDLQKDPLLLLDAVCPLLAQHVNLRLLMVGDGGLRGQVEERIARSALGSRICLAGARYGDEIAMMLRGADAFVMSSAYEGMPIAVLEALASGVPVISTPVGEVPTLLKAGVNGALASAIGPEALREGVLAVLDGPRFDPAAVAGSVQAYRPEVVLAAFYENHRRQAAGSL